jgi:hypothetical protein
MTNAPRPQEQLAPTGIAPMRTTATSVPAEAAASHVLPRRSLPPSWWMLVVGTIAAAASVCLPLGSQETALYPGQALRSYGPLPLLALPLPVVLAPLIVAFRKGTVGDWWALPLVPGIWQLGHLLPFRFERAATDGGFVDGPGMILGIAGGILLAYSGLLLWSWGRDGRAAELEALRAEGLTGLGREREQMPIASLAVLAAGIVVGVVGALQPLAENASFPLDFVYRAAGSAAALIAAVVIVIRGSVGNLWAFIATVGALYLTTFAIWGYGTFGGPSDPYNPRVGIGFVLSTAGSLATALAGVALGLRGRIARVKGGHADARGGTSRASETLP